MTAPERVELQVEGHRYVYERVAGEGVPGAVISDGQGLRHDACVPAPSVSTGRPGT